MLVFASFFCSVAATAGLLLALLALLAHPPAVIDAGSIREFIDLVKANPGKYRQRGAHRVAHGIPGHRQEGSRALD